MKDVIEIEEVEEVVEIFWQGAGWYAPCAGGGDLRFYLCGDDPQVEPDTYTKGLGMPDWFENPPTDMVVR